MKLILLLCIFSTAFSTEIHYDQQPVGYILRNRGRISNITRYANFEFEINMENLMNRTTILNENINHLLEICIELQPKIDCDLLAIFLKNKITNIDIKNSFRNKRGCFCDFFRELFGMKTTNDQEIIDRLQEDIRYNRNLSKNETILLNKTISTQNEINNKIFTEISNLKNTSKQANLNIKFLAIAQSMLMIVNDDADIADAILGIIKSPDYTHILKLIGFKKINDQLCEAQNTLLPNETIASGTYESFKRTLTLSQIKITKNDKNMLIKIVAPVVSGSWNVTEMVPISIKGERGVKMLRIRKRFVIQGADNNYAFLSAKFWNSCRKYNNEAICQFKFGYQKFCASNLYFKQDFTKCQFGLGIMPNIIRVNDTHIFTNIDSKTAFVMHCGNYRHAFITIKSAWIIIEQNCHLESVIKGNQSEINWPKMKINITVIPLKASRWILHMPDINDTDYGNNSIPSLQQLYPEINATFLDTTKPIEKIEVYSSNLALIVKIAIAIIGFVIFLVILRYLTKK